MGLKRAACHCKSARCAPNQPLHLESIMSTRHHLVNFREQHAQGLEVRSQYDSCGASRLSSSRLGPLGWQWCPSRRAVCQPSRCVPAVALCYNATDVGLAAVRPSTLPGLFLNHRPTLCRRGPPVPSSWRGFPRGAQVALHKGQANLSPVPSRGGKTWSTNKHDGMRSHIRPHGRSAIHRCCLTIAVARSWPAECAKCAWIRIGRGQAWAAEAR
jgi:hypothetical protein